MSFVHSKVFLGNRSCVVLLFIELLSQAHGSGDLKKHTGPPVGKASMLNFQFYGGHLEILKHL